MTIDRIDHSHGVCRAVHICFGRGDSCRVVSVSRREIVPMPQRSVERLDERPSQLVELFNRARELAWLKLGAQNVAQTERMDAADPRDRSWSQRRVDRAPDTVRLHWKLNPSVPAPGALARRRGA